MNAPMSMTMPKTNTVKIFIAIIAGLLGIAVHMAALALADAWVTTFPSMPDVVLAHLPRLNLFLVGEILFAVYLACFGFVVFAYRRCDIPKLLIMLGLFYGVRGLFLFTMPIGAPVDAPPVADRFALYPYPSHAYFPGGHIGLLFLCSFFVPQRKLRRFFLVAAILFGIGSLLTRAHYTGDLLGGVLLAYAVTVWGERHLKEWTLAPKP